VARSCGARIAGPPRAERRYWETALPAIPWLAAPPFVPGGRSRQPSCASIAWTHFHASRRRDRAALLHARANASDHCRTWTQRPLFSKGRTILAKTDDFRSAWVREYVVEIFSFLQRNQKPRKAH